MPHKDPGMTPDTDSVWSGSNVEVIRARQDRFH